MAKKFSVSVNVKRKIKVSSYFDEVVADSTGAAIRKAVSMVCVSGVFSSRICALLKETVRNCGDECISVDKKPLGTEVYVWTCENHDEAESE